MNEYPTLGIMCRLRAWDPAYSGNEPLLGRPQHWTTKVGNSGKRLACLLVAAFSGVGSAQAGSGWASTVTVTSVNARDIGTDVQVLGFNNPYPCTSNEWIRIENGVSNGDMMRATLLTAYATARPIKVWVGGCSTDGVSTVLAVWATP